MYSIANTLTWSLAVGLVVTLTDSTLAQAVLFQPTALVRGDYGVKADDPRVQESYPFSQVTPGPAWEGKVDASGAVGASGTIAAFASQEIQTLQFQHGAGVRVDLSNTIVHTHLNGRPGGYRQLFTLCELRCYVLGGPGTEFTIVAHAVVPQGNGLRKGSGSCRFRLDRGTLGQIEDLALSSSNRKYMQWTGRSLGETLTFEGKTYSRIPVRAVIEARVVYASSGPPNVAPFTDGRESTFGVNVAIFNHSIPPPDPEDWDPLPEVRVSLQTPSPLPTPPNAVAPATREAPQGAALSWSTEPGQLFQVQRSTDLRHWTPEGFLVEGDGGIATYRSPLSGEPSVFWRLRRLR